MIKDEKEGGKERILKGMKMGDKVEREKGKEWKTGGKKEWWCTRDGEGREKRQWMKMNENRKDKTEGEKRRKKKIIQVGKENEMKRNENEKRMREMRRGGEEEKKTKRRWSKIS